MSQCSTFLNPETRKAMGEQAVSLAKAVQYNSAGKRKMSGNLCHRTTYILEYIHKLSMALCIVSTGPCN